MSNLKVGIDMSVSLAESLRKVILKEDLAGLSVRRGLATKVLLILRGGFTASFYADTHLKERRRSLISYRPAK